MVSFQLQYKLTSNLTETLQEVTTSQVRFDDIDIGLMLRVVWFCYHPHHYPQILDTQAFRIATVQDTFAEATTKVRVAARLASELYALSQRFDIPLLGEIARFGFLNAYVQAYRQNHVPADDAESQDFIDLLSHVYTSTSSPDRGLRDIIGRDLKHRYSVGTHFGQHTIYLDILVDDVPGLAADVIRLVTTESIHRCTNCKKKQRWILRPSSCAKPSIKCTQAACITECKARSFCFRCCSVGTVE